MVHPQVQLGLNSTSPAIPGYAPSPGVTFYESDELEAMAHAKNYFRWILSQWRPYLMPTVVEVGAGTGNFSAHLLGERIERLILVEPARNLFEQLRRRFADHQRVELRGGTLEDCRRELRDARIGSVVSVNVLEHIPEDLQTLRAMQDVLVPGGTVLLLVPALRCLYGSMDRSFGHLRRYSRRQLAELLREAGLSIVFVRYMNLLGFFAWLLAGRVLHRRTLTGGMVRLSDRTLIPLTSWLEGVVTPPFGQSFVAVARKSETPT